MKTLYSTIDKVQNSYNEQELTLYVRQAMNVINNLVLSKKNYDPYIRNRYKPVYNQLQKILQ